MKILKILKIKINNRITNKVTKMNKIVIYEKSVYKYIFYLNFKISL
jgi:hypothetical protein